MAAIAITAARVAPRAGHADVIHGGHLEGTMKNKLRLDALQVETFEPEAQASRGDGSVYGYSGQIGPLCGSEYPNCTGVYGPQCKTIYPNCGSPTDGCA
ncbi:MAG: hypothetical protein JO306_09540 [Gemmatimonadetes bacterium]|nr:hypothetical protein [Gemmatimonadota bacterium]